MLSVEMPAYDAGRFVASQSQPMSHHHQHDDDNNSTSAYSSSSGSAPDSSSSPQFNQLAFQMQLLEISESRRGGSDSGTSSVDHTLEASGQTPPATAGGQTAAASSLPAGPWYFEVAGAGADGPLSAMKGTRNVTETVLVPSSEHVAEIVGRQGCKIKALRAKTNTYIKTPVRGEDPMFVVTGRPEDVDVAKAEIEAAADHFTQIRASRRHSQGGQPAPGHITAYVRVPYRVVGLVVGPKGGTIKRIQQETHTYIITPSREREPIFEVTGLPANVDNARGQIEEHILQRTGVRPDTDLNDAAGRRGEDQPQQQQLQLSGTTSGTTSSGPLSPTEMAYLMANAQYNKDTNAGAYASWQQATYLAAQQQQQQQSQQQQQQQVAYPQWSNVVDTTTNVFHAHMMPQSTQQNAMVMQQQQQQSMMLMHQQQQEDAFNAASQAQHTTTTVPSATWASYHTGWALAEPMSNSAATTIQSPMTDASTPIVPPAHLIMSDIWSDLNDPTD